MKLAFAGMGALATGVTAAVATWIVELHVVPDACITTHAGMCLYDVTPAVIAGSLGWIVAAVAFLALRRVR
jgi:hypothetical protein